MDAVTPVGDAADAFPPSQAQGADQALEDAWLLCRTLRAGADLRAYERERTRLVRRVSRLAASQVTNREPPTVARLARVVPPALAGRAYATALCRWGSVLRGS